jgi:pimeloyl-ACP methyl ester carboxylesterase
VHQVKLSCGVIDYVDTGGSGPVIVMLHGLLSDHTIWNRVIEELLSEYRCIAPTFPEGSHRHPVAPGYDLTIPAVAELIGEFLAALDLEDVFLVENDSGRAQTYAGTLPERVGRLSIVACEAFENFPPGLGGEVAKLVAWTPGGTWLLAQALRWPALRRSWLLFGPMTKKRVPDAVMDGWFAPLIHNPAIRRDFQRYCRSARRGDMMVAAEALRRFEKPVLVVWATEDKLMPRAHGQRFVDLLPDATLVEIDNSGTMIPLDQPAALARAMRDFVLRPSAAPRGRAAGSLPNRAT